MYICVSISIIIFFILTQEFLNIYFVKKKNLFSSFIFIVFILCQIKFNLSYKHRCKTYFFTNVNIFNHIFDQLRPHLTPAVMDILNGRLFITYYNVKYNEQIVRHRYRSVDDLLDVVRKSCYCPYVIDNAFLYKKKYVDGFYPYIFPSVEGKEIMHFNIHRFDKLFQGISIKNEKTNYGRILTGVIEAHSFFAYGRATSICSFVGHWTLIDQLEHYIYLAVLKMIACLSHKNTIKINFNMLLNVFILHLYSFL